MRSTIPSLVWSARLFERGGYAEEARNFILALDSRRVDVRARPLRWTGGWLTELSSASESRLDELIARPDPERFVHVIHGGPGYYHREPGALLSVGRTMVETDALPAGWADGCNTMDEIWVPSRFCREAFVRSGVDAGRVRVVGEGLRLELYDPAVPPLDLGLRGFVFMSVFGWVRRKGWDVLLRAFLDEFGPDDDVTLALKVLPTSGRTVDDHRLELEQHARERLGLRPGALDRVEVLDLDPGETGMPRLYRAADAFVLASRGEGWGRPYMEAMAMGLPTIGTRWSGQLDFMDDDTTYLVECDEVPVPEDALGEHPMFAGHRWAEPSVEHLRALMRHVYEDPDEAAERGRRARAKIVAGFGWPQLADAVVRQVDASLADRERPPPRRHARSVPSRGQAGSGAAGDLAEAVRAIAPPRAVVEELSGGYSATNFLIRTGERRMVCKVRPDDNVLPLRIVVRVSAILAARGIAHPRVLSPVIRVAAHPAILLDYLPGHALAQRREPLPPQLAHSLGRDLGRWLRAVHAIRLPPGRWKPRADRRFEAKLAGSLDARVLDRGRAAALRRVWRRLGPSVAAAPLAVIHRDLQDTNVILAPDGLSGIIDFEQARVADPLYDFVKLSDSVLPHHPRLASGFVAGYGEDLDRREVVDRFAAVSILEYLSGIVYFDRRGQRQKAYAQVARLDDALRRAEEGGAIAP